MRGYSSNADREQFRTFMCWVAAAFCVLIVLIGIGAGVWMDACDWSGEWSNGTRDGVIQKFSHKRISVLTSTMSWEGEVAMPGFQGKVMDHKQDDNDLSNVFKFSVSAEDEGTLVPQIEAIPPGSNVRVTYRQIWHNGGWSHESDYRVVKVEAVGAAPPPDYGPGK